MSSDSGGVGREEKENEKRYKKEGGRSKENEEKKTREKSVKEIGGLTMGEKRVKMEQKKERKKN